MMTVFKYTRYLTNVRHFLQIPINAVETRPVAGRGEVPEALLSHLAVMERALKRVEHIVMVPCNQKRPTMSKYEAIQRPRMGSICFKMGLTQRPSRQVSLVGHFYFEATELNIQAECNISTFLL